jgi:PAS domain S-box-containing protein
MREHFEGHTEFYECEVRMRHKDGHWVWALDRGKISSRTPEGLPLWVAGTHMDISERHEVQERLEQTMGTLQAVLDSAAEVLVLATDVNRTVTVFNRGAENLLGYSSSEMVGLPLNQAIFEPTQIEVIRETLALTLGREGTEEEVFAEVVGSKSNGEWTLVRKDGSTFIASMMISPMQGLQGEIRGFLGIAHDITRQKEYESSLRQAMKLAEQSSLAKSQFLANMSHEIRTPMNAILGMLQLLKGTSQTPRQQDYTLKTEGAARSLLALLNDILDFSKVEAGKMELYPEPFDLGHLLSDVSVILSSNLGNKDVDVLFDIDPAVPTRLVGDAARLKQVLINLGGNAIKFTAQGQVVLGWHLVERRGDRVRLKISMQDSGIGIAPEHQARIFEAFTQAEASTTRRFGGTGLGLVISTRLVRLMGSELELASTLGQGSTFSFELELPVAAQDRVDPEALSAPMTEVVRHTLLVDDNPVALATNATLMRSLGWQVREAHSGAEALDILRSSLEQGLQPFDALFVDWEMPDMDGWDTLRGVLRLFGERKAPALVMISSRNRSVLSERTDREHALLNGFLVKPLTADMFREAMAQAQNPIALDVQTMPPEVANAHPRILRLDGMRILVVEDNAINQQVAQELLENEGAAVSLASDGQQGVRAVLEAKPQFDVVLMDLQMPVMDGISATRALREHPHLTSLPIVAMTANVMVTDREACLAAGMNDHVGKPFDIQALVQTLVDQTNWTPRAKVGPIGEQGAVATLAGSDSTLMQHVWPAEVNVTAALARMGGNVGLFQRSMRAFVRDAQSMPERVRELQASGLLSDARRELHAFKGLCATLGVSDLSELAATAEKQVVQAHLSGDFAQTFEKLCSENARILPLLEDIARRMDPQALSATQDPAASTSGVKHPQLGEQLKALLSVLKDNDMVAMELHAGLQNDLVEVWGETADPLNLAMAELEFAAAAVECEVLLQQMN